MPSLGSAAGPHQSGAMPAGQRRADPEWGYDHGLPFDTLPPTHPMWTEAAVEEFVHRLFYHTSADDWRLADRAIRRVMRSKAGPSQHPAHGTEASPRAAHASSASSSSSCCSAAGGGGAPGADVPGEPCEAAIDVDAAIPASARALLCEYAERHKWAVRSAAVLPLREQRFLVAEAGSWGLGNRLYSLVSCLALALATNRTLLVRDWFGFPSRLPRLFAPPAALGSGGWGELSYEAVVAAALPSLGARGWHGLRAASAAVPLVEGVAERHV
eukprot:336959-Prymnesium_polylepis.1